MKKKTYITPAQQVVRLGTAPLLVSMSMSDTESGTQLAPGMDDDLPGIPGDPTNIILFQ